MSLDAVAALATVFGHGDDDHPLWLLAVRANVLLFCAALGVVLARRLPRLRYPATPGARRALAALLACTAVALGLRFVAAANLLDLGGIPYSRLLLGYRGYFATAQAYALLYRVTGRDLDHAILFDRLFGAATVPLVFALCRALRPRALLFPCAAAGLLALHPLHVLLSASDSLTVFSGFLCALSYLLLASEGADALVAGALGLALLTQVRYEDVLLAAPPVVWLAMRRRWLPAALCVAAGLAYAWPSLAAGIAFQGHTRLGEGWRVVTSNEVLGNPFLAIPLLFLAALPAALGRRPGLVLAGLGIWAVAGALAVVAAEGPHMAARAFSNWLVLLVMAAGHGLATLARRGLAGRVVVAGMLGWFALKPALYLDVLRTRYLEMAEHQAFARMLAAEPGDVQAVVVPDDEALRRRSGATIETLEKYRAVRRGLPTRGAPLVGLSAFLARTPRACDGGHCLFFAGLPCAVESINTAAPAQCDALRRGRSLETLATERVTAAPFERCAFQVGALRRDLCDPTVRTVDFTLERLR